jgi:molecular chaperone DnaK (HSP70)
VSTLVGVDLGTTRTVVATADRGNYPVLSFETGGGDATEWVPSLVAERDGVLRYGLEARDVAAEPGWTLVRSFKRVLSEPDVPPDRLVTVGGTALPIGDLLAGFLDALRRALAERSNLAPRRRRSQPFRAVVATPANAHGTQRFLTLDAFRRAGFEVEAMLNEPSAAGFEYAHRFRATLSARREHVVVYDLGGGTFDASLVRMTERHHDVVATGGIAQLGGDDFDAVLARLALTGAALDPEALPAPAWLALTERCREAKEALTPQSRRLTIDFEGIADGATRTASVSVNDFYAACAPLIEATLEAMRPVVERLPGEATPPGDPSAPPGDIAGIYVVGGASALPAVTRALRERFGRRVHRSPYPFAATAIGLAIAGDPGAGFELSDRFSRHFGVFREERDGREVTFDPVFGPDAPLPGRGAPVERERAYRPAHNVGHFRFAECAGLDPEGAPRGDVVPAGEALFAFDPALRARGVDLRAVAVRRLPETGARIEERYRLDRHGLVEVTLTDLDAGYARTFKLGRPERRSRAPSP